MRSHLTLFATAGLALAAGFAFAAGTGSTEPPKTAAPGPDASAAAPAAASAAGTSRMAVAGDAGAGPASAAPAGVAGPRSAAASPSGGDGGGSVRPSADAGTEPAADPAPEAPAPSNEPIVDAPFTRRGGFTFGISGYGVYGRASGYPNDLNKIDVPAWQSHVAGFGPGAYAWVGGSLTDWFTFGGGFAYSKLAGSELQSSAWAVLVRLETFPLFSLGGVWRDIGVNADFGTGSGSIHRKSNKEELAFTGSLSVVSLGAFWETWRLANEHIVIGPCLGWQYMTSDSLTYNVGTLGLRGAFYVRH